MKNSIFDKQLRENLKVSLVIDNNWLIPIGRYNYEKIFLEKYNFEFFGAKSLEPSLVKKEFKKQIGVYSDWYLDQYFCFISGCYVSIKLDHSIKDLVNLLKSDDKVNFELGFMVFNSLYKKA